MSIKSKCAVGIAAASLAASFVVSSPASAETTGCTQEVFGVRTDPDLSPTFQISEDSGCEDLNVSKANWKQDDMRGWFQNSLGVWTSGSSGFVSVNTKSDGLDILLTRISDGTTVRAEGRTYNQYATFLT